jgi:glycine cleavage system aminomethyltransferase T
MARCIKYAEGTVLTDESGNEVGVITSGGPSPCLKQNIAMGYINKPHNKVCRSSPIQRLLLDFREVGQVFEKCKEYRTCWGLRLFFM